MNALHSSSALACKVFEYWRGRNSLALSKALGLPTRIQDLAFEQKFRTGLAGKPPNLDVVLYLGDGSIVAIESKFLEPYRSQHQGGLKPKYFEPAPSQWAGRGLDACQALAERLRSGTTLFRWLNAEQLLKHILGLSALGSPWTLCYLWYEMPRSLGSEHAAEIVHFAEAISGDPVSFTSMSYQTLYNGLTNPSLRVDQAYLEYLGDRYFNRPA